VTTGSNPGNWRLMRYKSGEETHGRVEVTEGILNLCMGNG